MCEGCKQVGCFLKQSAFSPRLVGMNNIPGAYAMTYSDGPARNRSRYRLFAFNNTRATREKALNKHRRSGLCGRHETGPNSGQRSVDSSGWYFLARREISQAKLLSIPHLLLHFFVPGRRIVIKPTTKRRTEPLTGKQVKSYTATVCRAPVRKCRKRR